MYHGPIWKSKLQTTWCLLQPKDWCGGMQLLLDPLTKSARQRRGGWGWGRASPFLQSPHTQVWHQERPVDGRGTCATQAQWCNDGHEFSESRGSVHFIGESSGPRSELADWGSKWGVAGRGLLKSENALEKVTTSQNLMFSSTCWEPCGDLALYYFWIWKINCNWKTEGIKKNYNKLGGVWSLSS